MHSKLGYQGDRRSQLALSRLRSQLGLWCDGVKTRPRLRRKREGCCDPALRASSSLEMRGCQLHCLSTLSSHRCHQVQVQSGGKWREHQAQFCEVCTKRKCGSSRTMGSIPPPAYVETALPQSPFCRSSQVLVAVVHRFVSYQIPQAIFFAGTASYRCSARLRDRHEAGAVSRIGREPEFLLVSLPSGERPGKSLHKDPVTNNC